MILNSNSIITGHVHKPSCVSNTRFIFTIICIILSFASILMRLLWVVYYSHSSQNTNTIFFIPRRSDIIDTNGILLASNAPTASLYANPKEIIDTNEAMTGITSIFGSIDQVSMTKKLESKKGFIWIKRHLSPEQQSIVLKLGIPGLHFQSDSKRIYLHGSLMGHILGMADVDNNGIAGIEKAYDQELKIIDKAIKLTIDMRIQHAVYDELMNGVKEFKAEGACCVILESGTGKVVSMVSLPSFDPNHPDPQVQFNKAALGVYECGSIFKAFTMAMALEHNLANFETKFDATKPFQIGKFIVRDHKGKNAWLTLPQVFAYSSNIGTIKIALLIGPDRQRKFFEKIGMFKAVDMRLPEIAKPIMPSRWSSTTCMTAAYGYGISISPLHAILAFDALINGGVLHKPTIVESDMKARGLRVISPETSEKIRKLMRLAVIDYNSKFGPRIGTNGYIVGGKTGTAYVVENGKYNRDKIRTSFMAAFPINNPKYVIIVFLENPKIIPKTLGQRTGRWNAAPVTCRIIERLISIKNISKAQGQEMFDNQLTHLLLK